MNNISNPYLELRDFVEKNSPLPVNGSFVVLSESFSTAIASMSYDDWRRAKMCPSISKLLVKEFNRCGISAFNKGSVYGVLRPFIKVDNDAGNNIDIRILSEPGSSAYAST